MKETASLERAYRRVLACYPKAFRQESEQEILAVLLAGAQEGQRWPGLAESAALVRGALRMRLRPQGRNRARVLSTVLFGLATLELGGHHGAAQVLAVLTWLTGLAAVCLLWSWPALSCLAPGETR